MHSTSAPRFPSTQDALKPRSSADDAALLEATQRAAWGFFERFVNPENSLVPDSSQPDSFVPIASNGLALTCYPVAIERGWIARQTARDWTLAALRFFADAPQSQSADATGFNGFFYHFLDLKSGRRAEQCELSSIDTAILIAGVLTVAAYFSDDSAVEREIRERGEALFRGVDWNWMRDGEATVNHGWKPESGFLPDTWKGYNEALLLYILGLGSPTHKLPTESYEAWLSGYQWREVYGQCYV